MLYSLYLQTENRWKLRHAEICGRMQKHLSAVENNLELIFNVSLRLSFCLVLRKEWSVWRGPHSIAGQQIQLPLRPAVEGAAEEEGKTRQRMWTRKRPFTQSITERVKIGACLTSIFSHSDLTWVWRFHHCDMTNVLKFLHTRKWL